MALSGSARSFWILLSQILGWIYTLSWSISFYPQAFLNWQRRSTAGTSIDYPLLNVIGFVYYTVSISAFLFSPTVRAQYATRYPEAPEPTARFNDFAFGAHAVLITIICYSQYFPFIWRFHVPDDQRVSRPVRILITVCTSMVLVVAAMMYVQNGLVHQVASKLAWIDLAYAFGNVKVVATFCKYMPQAILNYRQQSTVGWSIDGILFDVVGGVLSLAQLVIDAGLQGEWSGIIGNPVKLSLAVVSLAFDFTFLFQHYILYRHAEDFKGKSTSRKDENTPLLGPV